MLTVNRKQFLAALDTVARVAVPKGTLPVLASVRIAPQTDGTLAVSCTDLYTAVTAVVDYEGDAASAPACGAEVKLVVDRAKRLPNGHARLAWTTFPGRPNASGKLTIADGPRSYQVRALPDEELPPIPSGDKATAVLSLPASTLARAIDRVLYSVSVDETRPAMNAVLWEVGPTRLRLVATDGHRLALHDESVTDGTDRTMLLSLSAMTHLRRMIGAKRCDGETTITIAADDKNVYIRVPSVATLTTRIVDGKFPPYDNVITPRAGCSRHVTVDRVALIDALKAVSVASPSQTGVVILTMHAEAIGLHAEDKDGNVADERVSACRITAHGEAVDFRIGVNARYLVDACSALDATNVCLSTSGEKDPILVTTTIATTVAIVMPVRLA